MKDRILREPTVCFGMVVWITAVTVFPLRLGMTGAPFASFALYVAIAGMLLAVADAILNPSLYHRGGDVLLQGVFWTIGLSVPALVAFAIGLAAAPAHQEFSDNLCVLGGLEGRYDTDDRTDTMLEDALEAIDDCGDR